MGHEYSHSEEAPSIPDPFLSFPKIKQGSKQRFSSPQKVDTYEFYALSDGLKRIYTAADALPGHGVRRILSPDEVSYMNLFINGMLQPRQSYQVSKEKLVIRTEDIPAKGTPIILQMIIVRSF